MIEMEPVVLGDTIIGDVKGSCLPSTYSKVWFFCDAVETKKAIPLLKSIFTDLYIEETKQVWIDWGIEKREPSYSEWEKQYGYPIEDIIIDRIEDWFDDIIETEYGFCWLPPDMGIRDWFYEDNLFEPLCDSFAKTLNTIQAEFPDIRIAAYLWYLPHDIHGGWEHIETGWTYQVSPDEYEQLIYDYIGTQLHDDVINDAFCQRFYDWFDNSTEDFKVIKQFEKWIGIDRLQSFFDKWALAIVRWVLEYGTLKDFADYVERGIFTKNNIDDVIELVNRSGNVEAISYFLNYKHSLLSSSISKLEGILELS